MARRVLFLTGAPEYRALNWDEAVLLNDFLTPFTSLLEPESSSVAASNRDALNDAAGPDDAAVWRSIPLRRSHISTGFSQTHALYDWYQGDSEFISAASFGESSPHGSGVGESSPSQSALSQFYDHSVAIHDGIPSSQLPTGSLESEGLSSFLSNEGTSRESDPTNGPSLSSWAPRPPGLLGHAHLSDLEDIPGAAYLESISPQTVSVNLIVAIISVAQPRTVKTRWGASKSLVELLVGDDTKSGFSVTFWLSSDHDAQTKSETDETLRDLRRQDVVLLRNVALGVFMKKVHGHSLRKGLTKVDLLHRRRLDRDDKRGLYSTKEISSRKGTHPQVVKARRVHEWADDFVSGGLGTTLGKRRACGRSIRNWELPPEDTQ